MYGQLYLDSQARVTDLVAPLSPAELARLTPACPLWSVQDVLAHLAGAAAAFVDGTPGDARPGSAEWTRAQVEARRGRSVADLLAEWARWAPEVAKVPLSSRSWLPIVHDTLSHEADIRGAIGAPRLPGDVLAVSWPLLTVPVERRLSPFGTVRLELDELPVQFGDGEPDLVVEASQYDFWRAWFGRRSAEQMRGWVRRGDADEFALTLPVFPARTEDLVETG